MPAPPGTMIYSILESAVKFFKEAKNREIIQKHCIDPIIHHVLDRLFPYITLACVLFSLILLMSMASVSLLLMSARSMPMAPMAPMAPLAPLAPLVPSAVELPSIIQANL